MNKQHLQESFIKIIIEYEKVIYKVCTFYVSENTTLPDLYQEVVCNLWIAYPKYRGESSLSTWIYRIALNTCISDLRKRKKHPQQTSLDFIDFENLGFHNSSHEIEELYKLINQLKPLDKAIILLYLEEKSYQEIANITGLTLTNVATRIKRTKRNLIEMSNL